MRHRYAVRSLFAEPVKEWYPVSERHPTPSRQSVLRVIQEDEDSRNKDVKANSDEETMTSRKYKHSALV